MRIVDVVKRALVAFVIAGAGAALVVLATPEIVRACSCLVSTPEENMGRADAVFEGRVVAVAREGGPSEVQGGGTNEVRLRVVRYWKGELGETVVIRTAENSAACGYPFSAGTSYLVYANRTEKGLETGLCSGTLLITEAQELLPRMGAGITPVDTSAGGQVAPREEPPATSGGCASCAVGTGRASGGPPIAIATGVVIGIAIVGRARARARARARGPERA